MTEIRFYHLTRHGTEKVLPDLALKALERGHRVLVKLPNEVRCRFYDDWLWRFKAESFLPHGQEGDAHPEAHPIWLSTVDDSPNMATMALVGEGASLPPPQNFKLICNVFDGNYADRLAKARQDWAALKKLDAVTLTYWQQNEDGRWVQKQ